MEDCSKYIFIWKNDFFRMTDYFFDKKKKIFYDLTNIKTGEEYSDVPQDEVVIYKGVYSVDGLKDLPSPDFLFFWRPFNFGKRIGPGVFSQWYVSPFVIDGITYDTAERYMMAQKAKYFNDIDVFHQIMSAETAAECKILGKKVKNFVEDKWDEVKGAIIFNANIAKFSQNKVLRKYLLATKDTVLAEASPFDRVYGIGMLADSDARIWSNWKGQNLLGFVLMEVRDYLRKK